MKEPTCTWKGDDGACEQPARWELRDPSTGRAHGRLCQEHIETDAARMAVGWRYIGPWWKRWGLTDPAEAGAR